MTEQEYRQNKELRDGLKQMLDSAPLKFAIFIISEKAKPRTLHDPKAGVHLDTLVSQHYNRLAGIQFALDSLIRLTEPHVDSDQERDEPEFMHVLPDEMKEALRNKRNQ